MFDKLYHTASKDLRNTYGRKGFSAFAASISKYAKDDFTSVIDDMEHALLSENPRMTYEPKDGPYSKL